MKLLNDGGTEQRTQTPSRFCNAVDSAEVGTQRIWNETTYRPADSFQESPPTVRPTASPDPHLNVWIECRSCRPLYLTVRPIANVGAARLKILKLLQEEISRKMLPVLEARLPDLRLSRREIPFSPGNSDIAATG